MRTHFNVGESDRGDTLRRRSPGGNVELWYTSKEVYEIVVWITRPEPQHDDKLTANRRDSVKANEFFEIVRQQTGL